MAAGLRFYLTSLEDDSNVLLQRGMPAARLGIGLSQEGRKLLSQDEQRELDGLYREALQSLKQEEKQRFFSLAEKGAAAADQEISESWALMEKALETLAPERRDRLFALIGKAVQLGQQKAEAEKKPEAQ